MEARDIDAQSREVKAEPDYRSLPRDVQFDETLASVDAGPVPDPAAGRNLDQHRALRDD
jgi:hypothetical protein